MTAKAITHRIGKVRNTVNEESNEAALGPPVIKPRGTSGATRKRKATDDPKQVVPDG